MAFGIVSAANPLGELSLGDVGFPVSAPDTLTALPLATVSPGLGTPDLGQHGINALTALHLATASPGFGTPVLRLPIDALTAAPLATASPGFGTPALPGIDALTAAPLATASPALIAGRLSTRDPAAEAVARYRTIMSCRLRLAVKFSIISDIIQDKTSGRYTRVMQFYTDEPDTLNPRPALEIAILGETSLDVQLQTPRLMY